MAQSDASRQAIPPRVREEAAAQVTALDALTFTASTNVTGAEVEALRDAISDILESIFINPTS